MYGDYAQIERLSKYVRVKKYNGEHIKCDRAFFNFNLDIIDNVEAKQYYFVSHANYEELGYKPPIQHEKITHYIGVSQFSADKLDEWGKKLGKDIKTKKCYNPLTLEPKKKVMRLVSACRLDDKVKGGERTLKLIEALDKYCLEHNRNYLWTIFTNPTRIKISSPNVVLMKPRIDVRPYIADSDYALQLSNDMETYCYTINEALGYGVPIVTTPLTITKELPITKNEQIILDWDCSNVDEVARQIFEKKVKPFTYEIPTDDWSRFLAKGESTYRMEEETKIQVQCIKEYFDNKLERLITPEDEPYEVSIFRAEFLKENNAVKILNKSV